MSAIEDIAAERQRQINEEGWFAEHDDKHRQGELAIAGAWYAFNSPYVGKSDCIGDPSLEGHELSRTFNGEYSAFRWPWPIEWWKPTNPRRDLVKAAALIVAEIERLDRAQVEQQS